MAEALTKYYYVLECPLASECNRDNFKKWKVWGETPAGAREKLLAHLCSCGLHSAHETVEGERTDMYKELCEKAKVDEMECNESPAKGGKKRKKKPADDEAAAAECQRPAGKPVILRPGDGSAGRLAVALPPRSSYTGDAMMSMSTTEMKMFHEQAERAHKAAVNAYRLSAAAATAFADQATIFQGMVHYVAAKLEDATGDQRPRQAIEYRD